MAYIRYEIKEYHVSLASYVTGTEIGNIKVVAAIECQEPGGNRCLIYFIEDDEQLPANKYNVATKTFGCYHHGKRFSWFIDILRNEKPVYCRIFTDNLHSSGIDTGFEPVGEGEKTPLYWKF